MATRKRSPHAAAEREDHGPFSSVEEAVAEFQLGRMIVVTDDEERENEGDLVLPAQFVTPEHINFMARYGRGLICVALESERLDRLHVPPMVQHNTAPLGTAFSVSVEAAAGVTTGISAADRARTVQVLIDPDSQPKDLVSPGHIFPLRAREGGVLVRAGQTEASVDLARLAGLQPGAVICEIMRPDGSMARLPDLKRFIKRHKLKMVSVEQIIRHRLNTEQLVERVADAALPTRYGTFRILGYHARGHNDEHIALVMGDLSSDAPVLVRVHSECLTGDIFGSLRCDCGDQMDLALERIAAEGRGVFVYMRQEGRGIGLHNKLRAYALQDQGLDTVEANLALGFQDDQRDYLICANMLELLGVVSVRLMTNNPRKVAQLRRYGAVVSERVAHELPTNPHNEHYLKTKATRGGHLLRFGEALTLVGDGSR